MKAKTIIGGFLAIVGGAALATLLINVGMILFARPHIYMDINQIPPRSVVLVLGSQVVGTRLSLVLEDRVIGGIKLMQKGKGQMLLLSGDNGEKYYNEVRAMQLYVAENAPNIGDDAILMDHAGFTTWDSMCRARDVFDVKDLIVVTQAFHISRAVSMARSLGLDAVGYSVDERRFANSTLTYWQFREYFARIKAFYSIITRAAPRTLERDPPF